MDCDQQQPNTCGIQSEELKHVLKKAFEMESELLRTYTITSERIHNNEALKARLQNFAEGNAKRSEQLLDELDSLQ